MLKLNSYVLDRTYPMRWLRRINRQTPKFFCSDAQRTQPRTGDDWDWSKRVWFPKWAKRYREVNGEIQRISRNHRRTPNSNVKLIREMSELQCDTDYLELFGPQCGFGLLVPNELDEDLQDYWKYREPHLARTKPLPAKCLMTSYDHRAATNLHLQELFGVPVWQVDNDIVSYWRLTGPYGVPNANKKWYDSATFMQLTNFGDDVSVIPMKSDRPNCTIAFWLFEDRVVVADMSGLKTW